MRLFIATVILFALTAPAALGADKKKLVLITQSAGFDHAVVKQPDGKPSVVETHIRQIADNMGNVEVQHSRDASMLTPEKLKQTDIVVFYTTGVLPMKPEDLEAWVNAGGKFLGIHPATDTFHDHPAYQKLINGEFQAHPWNQDTVVTIKVLDPDHAAGQPWADAGDGLTFKEEIYQLKNFDPADVHVVLGLDMEKTALKKPQFIPIAYCKEQGKGRVFYTSLGHREDVWTNPRYQAHLTAALKWLSGDASGDATPNPDVSKREDDIAKKVAPAEQPKQPEKKADAVEPEALPRPPDGFRLSVFARAPDIKSPASLAVGPDGLRKVFVGEDEYNTQPKRDPGLSRVKLCIDSDDDGKADRFTVFADKLNSPQGMTYVGGTLYVVHAPLLTALRDEDNDGVADSRVDLVDGLGPAPEGLVHHVPSGLHMGIDGWLYISIGDKGIKEATGKDGRKVTLWGGGVVRVRPDGTMLELYSSRTRNTFDVAVDPYLGVYTRDNTNDGNGWDSRLATMQRGAEYGYPSLFKNWTDEVVDPIASYGSGSATGATYVHEPYFPGNGGDSLYTCDWARGIVYRHELKRQGAGFEATQEEFLKDIRPADVEVDGTGKLFVADWGRRDWGSAGAVGSVYLLEAAATSRRPAISGATTTTTAPATAPAMSPKPFPDLQQLNDDDLLAGLASPSAVMRLECQQEMLRRGRGDATVRSRMSAALRSASMRRGALYARVAALFTLKQLEEENANRMLATLAQAPELREFALRALIDRDDQLYGVNEDLFIAGLKDPNPRVREQAAIGIGHLRKPNLAAGLVDSTSDTDSMVRHAAMQSLRKLGPAGRDACIAALGDVSKLEVVTGALRTLREFHDDQTVNAVAALRGRLGSSASPALRQEITKALAKLYHVQGAWDGKSWWTPHPDTRGPYYVHKPWAQSSRVAGLLIDAANDSDLATAKLALHYIGLVEMNEAVTPLTRMIAAGGPAGPGGRGDDAAKALIAIKSSSPEALAAMERIVLSERFSAEVRGSAAQSLAGIDADVAQPILLRLLVNLDRAPESGQKQLPPGLIERVADALASQAASPQRVLNLLPLLNASRPSVRTAAAAALLRSSDASVRAQVSSAWTGGDPQRIEALLLAVPRVPAEAVAPYAAHVHDALRDGRAEVRQAATLALGHLGDASAVKDLVRLATRDRDPLPAVSALAGIDPAAAADDQLLPIATLLVENSARIQKTNNDAYVRLVGAAQKFLDDPRVPIEQAMALRSKLRESGVIYSYFLSDPIALAGTDPNAEEPLKRPFPPEMSPAGPFNPFSAGGKEISWKPITVKDPTGLQPLDVPADGIVYLHATVRAVSAGTGYLTCGSDDAIAIWLNGKQVHFKPMDRGLKADNDRVAVWLEAGTNTLLLKVYNRTGPAGVQARVRSRVIEFPTPDEAARAARAARAMPGAIPTDLASARGRSLFENDLGCIKCHTLNREDAPRGPFLGDAGGRFDDKHLAESILRPSEKIAQGFGSEQIIMKAGSSAAGGGAADVTGFVTRETADEVELRDLTGRVIIVRKADIANRKALAESMMPTGLTDGLSLDQFADLLTFLTSLK